MRAVAALFLMAAPAGPVFEDATAALGIHFKHEGSPTSSKYLIETMGGGVALFDIDNDGRLDIFFANGAALLDPMTTGQQPDKSNAKYANRLYRQKPDGRFEDVTARAGVRGSNYAMGVATGDFDNDGYMDLYVTGYGANALYRNNGDGTFADVTAKSGTRAHGWSTSAGFFDYDRDGDLDLFVGRYVDMTFENNRYCGEKKPGGRAYCHPDNYAGVANMLFRNNGDGTFTDVSKTAGIANPDGKTLGISFADFDNDGWPDVYAANDSVRCFLYRNKGDGTFEDVALAAGTGFNEDGKTFAGMGTHFADYNNDGRADIVVTDLSNERYILYRNNGDGSFADVTTESGLGRATHPYSGWSTAFLDYDNDGWKDLFVAQGHVMDTIAQISSNLRYLQPPLLLRNARGQLSPAGAGVLPSGDWAGRGAAFGDIDNDGDLDVVVANVNQNAYVLRNQGGNRNGWIRLTLRGKKSNRDGLGARIKVTGASGLEQSYSVTTAVGYQSASDKRLVIGLGQDRTARLEIHWPAGGVQLFASVTAGQTVTAIEP
ncbi:MAG: CRTAC1 family protein [Acidobacteria bacterium]|nr:CRTAC1 family protein [Acidobacteriota bacterium]